MWTKCNIILIVVDNFIKNRTIVKYSSFLLYNIMCERSDSMLLEQFSDTLLDQNKETVFKEISLSDIDKKISNYTLVEPEDLKIAPKLYYNERVVTLDEFRQETIVALLFKFTQDVLLASLHLSDKELDPLINKIVEESSEDQYSYIFDGFEQYSELFIANDKDRQFTIVSNANLSDDYCQKVFTNLGDLFSRIVLTSGYSTISSQDDSEELTSEYVQ